MTAPSDDPERIAPLQLLQGGLNPLISSRCPSRMNTRVKAFGSVCEESDPSGHPNANC
jgi:hypothetical protein